MNNLALWLHTYINMSLDNPIITKTQQQSVLALMSQVGCKGKGEDEHNPRS